MRLPILTSDLTVEPVCFGKLWSSSAPECAGGDDAAFTDAETGQHVRQECGVYFPCELMTTKNKMATPQAEVPVVTTFNRTLQQLAQQLQHAVPSFHPQGGSTIVPPEMGPYLSVPEPRHMNESAWRAFWREVLRAVGKSVAQTATNFLDTQPLKPLPSDPAPKKG